MPNQLEQIMPRIVARGLLRFRETAILPRLVNNSLSADAAQRGDAIKVPISTAVTAEDVTPSEKMPTVVDQSANVVSVSLDHWKRAAFYLTDAEMMQIEAQNSFIPLQMSEAIHALAVAVNQSIIDLHPDIPTAIGTPGIPAFKPVTQSSSSVEVEYGARMAIEARKLLNEASAPKTGRFAVIDYETEANALGLPQFYDAQKAGSTSVPMEGEIGRKFGIDWYANDLIPRHVNKLTGKKSASTASKGDTKITLDTAPKDIRRGDILTIDSVDYVVASVEAVSNQANQSAVTLTTGLHTILAGNTAVAFKPSFRVGLAMHRDAVALAMRPLTTGGMEMGANGHMMSVTDPQTGLSLRLEVSRQYKRTVWEFDVLWGVALVRPDLAVKLYG